MFNSAAWSVTQSTPAITWVMSTAPELSATLTDTMPASRGHAHEPFGVGGGLRGIGAGGCAGDDAGHVGAVAERVDEAGPVDAGLGRQIDDGDDLPRVRATGATPVSITATFTPDPSMPRFHSDAGADLVDDPVHRSERQPSGHADPCRGSC